MSESNNIAIAAIFDEDPRPNASLNAGRGDRYAFLITRRGPLKQKVVASGQSKVD
jgi:hypothetical protein